MNKFNYKKLKNRIRDYYDNQENFAKELKISSIALNYKLNGKSKLSCEDIYTMINLLDIKPEEINELFFTIKS